MTWLTNKISHYWRPAGVSCLLLALVLVGCGHTSVRWIMAPAPASVHGGSLAVIIQPHPALPPPRAGFDQFLLGLVREQDPQAQLRDPQKQLATERTHPAEYVLTVSVYRWRDAATQYTTEPDIIELAVRLTRPGAPAPLGDFVFHGRGAGIAVRDAPAERLLGEKFKQALRQLIAASGQH